MAGSGETLLNNCAQQAGYIAENIVEPRDWAEAVDGHRQRKRDPVAAPKPALETKRAKNPERAAVCCRRRSAST